MSKKTEVELNSTNSKFHSNRNYELLKVRPMWHQKFVLLMLTAAVTWQSMRHLNLVEWLVDVYEELC